ncbi:MAG: efflux RND transporter periplasmic adaptor subunit [Pseudomonadota bacterium]
MTKQTRPTRNQFRSFALAGAAAVVLAGFGATQLAAKTDNSEAAEEITAPENGPTVTIAHPTVKEIVEWDEYTGRFEAIDNVEIRARVSGYLTEIAFTPGEIVEAGDLLFRVDPRPYEAALAAAKADLAGADASLRNARAEYRRGKKLLAKEAISQEAVDNRLRAQRVAEADWAAAQANVEQAELNLEFTEVRAPITGRISDDFVSEGNLIVGGAQGGTVLSTLVSMDPIYFEFTASEADYLKYLRLDRQGARVSGRDEQHPVRVKLMDEESFAHEGVLSFVDNQIDRSTGTMRGRATLSNPDGVLAPGMFGRLELLGSGAYDAVMIPDAAVQTDQSEKFVWVATNDGVAARQPVKLGPIVDGLRVVRAGLDGDANVIVSGTQFVQANAHINAQEADDARLAQLNLR